MAWICKKIRADDLFRTRMRLRRARFVGYQPGLLLTGRGPDQAERRVTTVSVFPAYSPGKLTIMLQ
jgi:hypothetical protein